MAEKKKTNDSTKKTSILITAGFIGLVVLIIVGLILYNTIGREKSSIATDTPTDRMIVNSEEIGSNFVIKDLEGNKVRLSDYRGKLVVMYYWATWCEPCIDNLNDFQAAYDKYKDQVSFLLISNADDAQTTKKFMSEKGLTVPAFVDEEQSATKAYGISSLPTTVMIDKNGKIHYQNIGTLNKDAMFSFIDGLINK